MVDKKLSRDEFEVVANIYGQFKDRKFVPVLEAMQAAGFDNSHKLCDYARTVSIFRKAFGPPVGTFSSYRITPDGYEMGVRLKGVKVL